MDLAISLGKTLEEIYNISEDELSRWICYDRINGLPKPWLQTGVVCSAIDASRMRASKHDTKVHSPDFYMLPTKRRKSNESESGLDILSQQFANAAVKTK